MERALADGLARVAVAGLFWVPVIFMQIEMRDLARKAAAQTRVAAEILCTFPPLVSVRDSGFGSVMAILWLMIAKPL